MEILRKARAALVVSQPFFGSLALRLKLEERHDIETMAVDGVHLFYNPEFVARLSFDELLGVCVHEVLHLACAHHARRGSRDPKLWNKACDYAINGLVADAGFTLPAVALREDRFDGLAAEAIYAQLQQDATDCGNSSGAQSPAGGQKQGAPGSGAARARIPGDPGGCGAVMDAPGQDGQPASTAELSRAEADWTVATLQAAQAAKAAGKRPGALARLVETLRKPTVDWREVLKRFVQQRAKSDYRWTPPNRRFVWQGLYLPSLRSDQLGPVITVVDTSGSIKQQLLDLFAAQLTAILQDCRPEALHVVYCDSAVNRTETFTPDDPRVTLTAKGGGGTDFRPPFAWVEEQGLRPACLIYLTDLDCARFPEPPPYPTLWAATKDKTAPFGEILRINPIVQ